MIEQYKKENKQLKTLRDELIANKRVIIFILQKFKKKKYIYINNQATTPGLSKTQGSFISWSQDVRDEVFRMYIYIFLL